MYMYEAVEANLVVNVGNHEHGMKFLPSVINTVRNSKPSLAINDHYYYHCYYRISKEARGKRRKKLFKAREFVYVCSECCFHKQKIKRYDLHDNCYRGKTHTFYNAHLHRTKLCTPTFSEKKLLLTGLHYSAHLQSWKKTYPKTTHHLVSPACCLLHGIAWNARGISDEAE